MHACKDLVRTSHRTKSVYPAKTHRFNSVRENVAVRVNMEEIRRLVGRSRGQDDILTSREMYLLTPWNKVLLEKLTGSQLVKKYVIVDRVIL